MYPVEDGAKYSGKDLQRLSYIIEKFKPDIIQIFGTEHSFQCQLVNMVDALGYIDKLAIWIQGVVSIYSLHYYAGLSEKVARTRTIKEWIKRNNIRDMKTRMTKRGEEEAACLRIAKHVFVRTDWDQAVCRMINPELCMHVCNESLRPSFYSEPKWDVCKMERHTIFLSQSHYPIKGLHMVIEALRIVVQEFPDARIRTTGIDYLHYGKMIDKLRISSYQKEIMRKLRAYDLYDKLEFLGTLSEEEMREQYLKANVFVSPSAIENSPNSLGEAMLLGTPVVASDVGGVKTMMEHGKDGFVYPFDEYYILAEYICKIFRDDELAISFSQNARRHAAKTHDVKENYAQLIREYHTIVAL
ncbi:MAG: glycosyltransferase family 4 protein [Lachnospiraceae bacterium]|nr:glycosyltransferase family 4 protein [Lachnospiraceae bacterium]